MKQKQSMVIFVNYKDNYDTTTTTANNSMGFDLSALQSCFSSKTKATDKFEFTSSNGKYYKIKTQRNFGDAS